MLDLIFASLEGLENGLWAYLCVPLLIAMGLYFSVKSRFLPLRAFPTALAHFWHMLRAKGGGDGAVHPINAFFACVGGCVGIGNIVAVCTAVQLGGPGALIWLWLTAFIGIIIKYSEVYLGMRYRVAGADGGWRGGPMYYIQQVFSGRWAPLLMAVLLCLYGVEVYQFSVIASSVSYNFDVDKGLVVAVLLLLVLYAGSGGVGRVGAISSAVIPLFIVIYLGMVGYVFLLHHDELFNAIAIAWQSAFTGHAATGAFVGSTMMMAVTHGLKRACYTGDLGIGYASVIHSESSEKVPERQASLVIIDIFLDSFIICSATILLILVTGVWQQNIAQELLVQRALETVFSHSHLFMPLFLFLLGYSTINAYFVVGLNCAEYLAGSRGRWLYFVYAAIVLTVFSYTDTALPQTIMTIVGGLLLLVNCYTIWRLRERISFEVPPLETAPAPSLSLSAES